jgi:hypothetical protein
MEINFNTGGKEHLSDQYVNDCSSFLQKISAAFASKQNLTLQREDCYFYVYTWCNYMKKLKLKITSTYSAKFLSSDGAPFILELSLEDASQTDDSVIFLRAKAFASDLKKYTTCHYFDHLGHPGINYKFKSFDVNFVMDMIFSDINLQTMTKNLNSLKKKQSGREKSKTTKATSSVKCLEILQECCPEGWIFEQKKNMSEATGWPSQKDYSMTITLRYVKTLKAYKVYLSLNYIDITNNFDKLQEINSIVEKIKEKSLDK